MRLISTSFFLILLIFQLHANDLVGIKEIYIEEKIKSVDGEEFSNMIKLKEGDTYENKTETTAKFFISDKVGGSISKGGKFKLNAKDEQTKTKITLNLLSGTTRFRIKKLKKQDFKVKTPSAVAGVRGTSFSVYLNDNWEEIKLPEGELAVTDTNGKQVVLNAWDKVTIKKGGIGKPKRMDGKEQEQEVNKILSEATFRNFNLEKAFEKEKKEKEIFKQNEIKYMKSSLESIDTKINKELKKKKKLNDEEAIKKLNKMRYDYADYDYQYNHLGLSDMFSAMYKKKDAYINKKISILTKLKEYILKVYDNEIKKAKQNKEFSYVIELEEEKFKYNNNQFGFTINPKNYTKTNLNIQSIEVPSFLIFHKDNEVCCSVIKDKTPDMFSHFRIIPGLAGGKSISFESIHKKGFYLRNFNFKIDLQQPGIEKDFKKNASFIMKPGLYDYNLVSFQSVNHPNHYICLNGNKLYIREGWGETYRKGCTWRILTDN